MKLLISLLLVISVSGCATVRKALYSERAVQVAPASTNAVVVYLTNAVPNSVTNQLPTGQVEVVHSTNWVIQTSTNYVVTPASWTTNLVVRPEVQTATATVSAAPVPGAGLAASLASLAIAGYASWINRKNQNTANQVAGTLVDNFEHLRQVALSIPGYTPEIDDKVMQVVKGQQLDAGVKGAINTLVDARTDTTAPKPQS